MECRLIVTQTGVRILALPPTGYVTVTSQSLSLLPGENEIIIIIPPPHGILGRIRSFLPSPRLLMPGPMLDSTGDTVVTK